MMVDPSLARDAADASALASILVSNGPAGVRLTGRAAALADVDLKAAMTIEKSGRSGKMSTRQGGSFSLKAGEEADVATAGLSMAPGDRLSVELRLTSDGREISTATLSVGH